MPRKVVIFVVAEGIGHLGVIKGLDPMLSLHLINLLLKSGFKLYIQIQTYNVIVGISFGLEKCDQIIVKAEKIVKTDGWNHYQWAT